MAKKISYIIYIVEESKDLSRKKRESLCFVDTQPRKKIITWKFWICTNEEEENYEFLSESLHLGSMKKKESLCQEKKIDKNLQFTFRSAVRLLSPSSSHSSNIITLWVAIYKIKNTRWMEMFVEILIISYLSLRIIAIVWCELHLNWNFANFPTFSLHFWLDCTDEIQRNHEKLWSTCHDVVEN